MNVFVSGPLMFREVLKAVTGTTFPAHCGVLRGYAQFTLRDEGQSAMIPFPDRVVDGVVYLDVDEAALKALDAFQGPRFEHHEVSIETETGDWIEAEAYVFKVSRRALLTSREWDEDEYREHHLKKAIAACRK